MKTWNGGVVEDAFNLATSISQAENSNRIAGRFARQIAPTPYHRKEGLNYVYSASRQPFHQLRPDREA